MNLPTRGSVGLYGRPILGLGRAHASYGLLAFALVGSALAAGAIHLPLLVGLAVLVVASSLALVVRRRPGDPASLSWSWRNTTGAAVWWLLALYCLLQSLPLPLAMVEQLAPGNADIWARALRPFDDGATPAWVSLSLAPARTLMEALKLGTYGLIFGVSVQLSRHWGMRRMAALAFGASLAVALVTAAHRIIGAERLYGFYTPLDAHGVAPLLNANNRAGYLNLGFFCGLGLLLRAGPRPSAALIGLGLAFLAAEILLCMSMGGTGLLGLGVLLVFFLPDRGRRGRHPGLSRWAQAGVLLSIGLAATLMAAVAKRGSWLGLADQSLEKLELALTSAQIAADHLALGIGRGAFGSVFPAYQRSNGDRIFEHAENFPLQWATEWGGFVTLAALLAVGWVLAPAFRRGSLERPAQGCALVGCVVLLLQNLVDLGLEVPAVAGLLCAVLGGLSGSSLAPSPASVEATNGERRVTASRWLVAGSVLTAGSAALAVNFGVPSTAWLRQDLHAQLSGSRGPASPAFWSALRDAVEAYPAEFYFPLLGSSAALGSGQDAIPWISRALERNPTSARTHLQLGRVLRSRGATLQALGALRRAMELDPAQVRVVVDLVQSWRIPPVELLRTVPEGTTGADFLSLLATRTSDVARRVELLEHAAAQAPARLELQQTLALELLQDLGRAEGSVLCAGQRDACLARAAEHVRRASEPRTPSIGVLEARLLVARGEAQAAERHLAEVCGQFPSDLSCAEARASQALANRSQQLPDAINAVIALACSTAARCGKAHLGLGNLFATAGQWLLAIGHYRRAVQEAPSQATYAALARAADHSGQSTLAADARRRMQELAVAAASTASALKSDSMEELAKQPPTPPEPLPTETGSFDR